MRKMTTNVCENYLCKNHMTSVFYKGGIGRADWRKIEHPFPLKHAIISPFQWYFFLLYIPLIAHRRGENSG